MPLVDAVLAFLSGFNGIVEKVGRYLGLTLIGAMTLVILYQVFMRYVLNDPPTWSEEIARFMMVWMTFLVAPLAYRHGMNVAIETLSSLIRGRIQWVLQLVLNALILCSLRDSRGGSGHLPHHLRAGGLDDHPAPVRFRVTGSRARGVKPVPPLWRRPLVNRTGGESGCRSAGERR